MWVKICQLCSHYRGLTNAHILNITKVSTNVCTVHRLALEAKARLYEQMSHSDTVSGIS